MLLFSKCINKDFVQYVQQQETVTSSVLLSTDMHHAYHGNLCLGI